MKRNLKIILIVLCVFIFLFLLYRYGQERLLQISFSTYTLEYGEDVDFNSLLEPEQDLKVVAKDYEKNEIGLQNISFDIYKYGFKVITRNYLFNVEDSVKPNITLNEDNITLEYGQEYNPESNIKSCSDPVDGEIKPDIETSLNVNKVGEYVVKVSAEDVNGNKETKEFKVVVDKKQEAVKTTEAQNSSENKLSDKSNKETVTDKNASDSDKVASNKVASSNKKKRTLNFNAISEYKYKYSSRFRKQLLKGDYHLEFDSYSDWKSGVVSNSIAEVLETDKVIQELCEVHENCVHIVGQYTVSEDGQYLDGQYDVADCIKKSYYTNYVSVLRKALNGMDLYCTDKEMVDQINEWICKNISYKKTNHDVYQIFKVDKYKGQCYHYARLFQDMCKIAGIKVGYQEGKANGEGHAWNYVIVGGKKYWFDVCWNDNRGSLNQYSWVSEKKFRKTHSW